MRRQPQKRQHGRAGFRVHGLEKACAPIQRAAIAAVHADIRLGAAPGNTNGAHGGQRPARRIQNARVHKARVCGRKGVVGRGVGVRKAKHHLLGGRAYQAAQRVSQARGVPGGKADMIDGRQRAAKGIRPPDRRLRPQRPLHPLRYGGAAEADQLHGCVGGDIGFTEAKTDMRHHQYASAFFARIARPSSISALPARLLPGRSGKKIALL